jgi:exonuclease SbcC
MRLSRLEISGFGAFRDPTTVDFTDTDFFALVGPTGSGKSTVIDAICFALYGSVPRYEDKRLSRYVVTLGASESRVSLNFELEAKTYVATRVVRRAANGSVSTKEARLECIDSAEVLAGAEREMNAAVVGLLRLDFDDFTKCVVLPQGDFAQFLRAKGEERRALLIKLLNLEVYLEVGQLAGRRGEEAKSKVDLLRQRVAELAFATDDARKAVASRSKAIVKLAAAANKARPKIDESLRQAEAQQRDETAARKLMGALAKVTVPDEARRHGDALAAALRVLKEAQEAAIGARADRQKVEETTGRLPDLAELRGALLAHQSLATCEGRLAGATALAQSTAAEEAQAKQVLEEAERALDRARVELADLKTAHQAEDLAQHLTIGEACPVCLQVVKSRPKHHAPQALTSATRAEQTADKAVATARRALTTPIGLAGKAKGTAEALIKECDGLRAQVKAHPDPDKLAATTSEVSGKLDALDSARKAEDAAATAITAKQGVVEKLGAKTSQLETTYGGQRDAVAALGPPARTDAALLVDWEALAFWAGGAVEVQENLATKAASAVAEHMAVAQTQTTALIDGCAELELDVSGTVVEVLTTLAEAGASAEAESRRITDAIAESKEKTTQVKGLDEQAEVASLLRAVLRSNRFPEWLVTEALELLVLDASATLRGLTNDEFSLALGEQEFMVIDHANADERRSARTLSGGETFQAALALALALSDQIRNLAAEGAPMLDALFLDEGFGTLDPETLETVAATIENLGQSGRMVGIITHVRELAERVPVRFEVRKGPRTSTIEKLIA